MIRGTMPSYQLEPAREAPPRLGRYELIGHLATGGMAEIHLARLAGEAGFEKIVVVKRLLPELVASPTYVAMFLDEGKLVARLDHSNVCEVYELGREGAEYYLAMPYLDGVSVQELIAQPRDPDRIAELRVAAGVIAQACAGLHHAHELRDADGAPAGLVHRDVSPSNLFVTSAGVVKVLDFGIAKVRGAAETEAGTIKGKQQYMAPEQLLGEPLDRRCDVFALGIVLFELATHQRLFKRASDYLSARAILEDPIPRADAVDPAVPAALADVIARALSRERSARYADAAALARALEAALAPHGGLAAAAEIAAAVASTDELTAQRTRQARVLGEAQARAPEATAASAVRTTGATGAAGAAGARTTGATGAAGAPATGSALSELVTRAVPAPARPPPSAQIWRWLPAAASAGVAGAVVALVLALGSHPGAGGSGTIAAGSGVPAVVAGSGAGVSSGSTSSRGASSGAPAPLPHGLLSIDATPNATIYVDGVELGATPIVRRPLAPGRHQLRAVLPDGRAKELAVDIPAGAHAPPLQLTGW
jgi:tRNA A-37 threonylcarbamoyl transferase component Bud32